MNKITIASIAALLATSSLALAHGNGAKGLHRFDRDGNGVVTRDEMRTSVLEQFDKADANKDGRLTLDEVQAAHQQHAGERFAKKDKNGDGRLSRDEVAHMPDEMFARLDKNTDGALSKDELAAISARHGEHAAARFQKEDSNHDGAISRDERVASAQQRFASIDANNDGVVTADEAKAHHGHGRGHHEQK